MPSFNRKLHKFLLPMAGLLWTISAQQAQATEGGASLYLLGTGGPGAGAMPPLEGVFFDSTAFYYDASAKGNKQFVVGGNVIAGLDVKIVADFYTVLWVPTTDFAGGTLALGATVPLGAPQADVNARISGPLGRVVSISRHDSALVVGDPVATASLGWTTGDLHIAASTILNMPAGNYREDKLANIAFHRWAGDASLALSWINPKTGWDVSGKMGVTFNGNNDFTDYNSGNEFHLEGAVEKTLSPVFSLGVQGYYFKQISGDSGAGARLGSFKGEEGGAGVTAAVHVNMGMPATFRLRVLTEFGAVNRVEGTSAFLSFTIPLSMKMPAGARAP